MESPEIDVWQGYQLPHHVMIGADAAQQQDDNIKRLAFLA
jgi:hypothetical protein